MRRIHEVIFFFLKLSYKQKGQRTCLNKKQLLVQSVSSKNKQRKKLLTQKKHLNQGCDIHTIISVNELSKRG